MGLWETVRSWFASEAESARDVANNLESEWSTELDKREAELKAGPGERLEILQDRISDNTSSFDEIKAKIESTAAVDAQDGAGSTGADHEIVDAELIDDNDGESDSRSEDSESQDSEPQDGEPQDGEPEESELIVDAELVDEDEPTDRPGSEIDDGQPGAPDGRQPPS